MALCSFLVPGWGQLIQERHLAAIVQFAVVVVVWYIVATEFQIKITAELGIEYLYVWFFAWAVNMYSAVECLYFTLPPEVRKKSSTPSQAPNHQQATPTHQQASPARRQAKPVSRRAKPVPQSAALPIDQDPTRFARTPPTEDDLDDEWRDYSEAEMIAAVEEFYASDIVINEYGDVVHDIRDLSDSEIAELFDAARYVENVYVDSDGGVVYVDSDEGSDSGGYGGGNSDSGDFY